MALPQAWRRLQWVQRLRRRRLQWQLRRLQRLPLIGKNRWARVEHPIGPRPFLE